MLEGSDENTYITNIRFYPAWVQLISFCTVVTSATERLLLVLDLLFILQMVDCVVQCKCLSLFALKLVFSWCQWLCGQHCDRYRYTLLFR